MGGSRRFVGSWHLIAVSRLNILIISEYIAPVQSVASIRWTKIGKYLALAGHTVSILTNEKIYNKNRGAGRLALYDETIAGDCDFFSEIHTFRLPWRLKALYFAWNERAYLKSKKDRGVKARAQPNWRTATLKNSLMASAAISQFPDIAKDFDVVISTYDPLWPHIVAAQYKKKHPGLFWVSDFRDQVYGPNYYLDQRSRGWPSKVTRSADLITYVSHTGKSDLGLPSGRECIELTNGFDSSAAVSSDAQYKPNDKFTMVYTGTLADLEKRDIGAVVEAISILIKMKRLTSEDIELLYAGMDDNIFRTAIKGSDYGFCKSLGLLTRAQAISLQSNADVLLLLSWNTEKQQGILTGKLYEYLASGRPVCAWVQGGVPDSRVKSILDETGAGEAFEEGAGRSEQINLMAEYIYMLFAQWRKEGRTRRGRSDIDAYSHEGIAKRLDDMVAAGMRERQQVNNG